MSGVTGVTGAVAVIDPLAAAVRETESTGVDFSAVLAEALENQVTESVITGASLPPGATGYTPMYGTGGIESAIMAAASSGETSDAQIAMLMLCMMMQSGGGGDYSQIMGLMCAMLSQLNGGPDDLRDMLMRSDYEPYILDTIDKNVFKTKTPDVTGTGKAVLPVECWKPTTPAITNEEGRRSPEALRAVIDQFHVESSKRYEPYKYGSDTYCNIFLWDVTSAMGCEIPHYIDPNTGAPMQYPNTKGAKEMGAIATEKWLVEHGESYGWRETDAATAQRYANQGKAAVTTAGNIGHVQVVCPSDNGSYDAVRGVTVAQAGRIVTGYTHLSSIYSTSGQKSVRYFVHE